MSPPRKTVGLWGSSFRSCRLWTFRPWSPEVVFLVAVDAVGAGNGEVVLCTSGSSARMTGMTEDRPVDAVVVAIVDSVEMEGATTYRKHP